MKTEFKFIIASILLLLLCGCSRLTEEYSEAKSEIAETQPQSKTIEYGTEASRYEDPVGIPFTATDIEAGDAYEIILFDYDNDLMYPSERTIYLLTTDMAEPERSLLQNEMKSQLLEVSPALNNCQIATDDAIRIFSLSSPSNGVQCFYVPVTDPRGITFEYAFYRNDDPQNKEYAFSTYPIRELKMIAGFTSPETPAMIVTTDKTVYFIVGSKAYCFDSPYDNVPSLPELDHLTEDCKVVRVVLR